MAGCSGEGDSPLQDPAAAAPETAAAASPITPEYLAGEWCYLRYEAGGEVSLENITYVFAADGTLKYQNNSSTEVDKPGTFEVKDGILKIKPALAMFDFLPVTVDKDAMILEAMGAQSFWKRGACGSDTTEQ